MKVTQTRDKDREKKKVRKKQNETHKNEQWGKNRPAILTKKNW